LDDDVAVQSEQPHSLLPRRCVPENLLDSGPALASSGIGTSEAAALSVYVHASTRVHDPADVGTFVKSLALCFGEAVDLSCAVGSHRVGAQVSGVVLRGGDVPAVAPGMALETLVVAEPLAGQDRAARARR